MPWLNKSELFYIYIFDILYNISDKSCQTQGVVSNNVFIRDFTQEAFLKLPKQAEVLAASPQLFYVETLCFGK